MPPLKQPTPLEKMSMDVLVGYFVKFFRTCTDEESLDEFREGVAFIKKEIRPRMPGTFAVELYNKVLQEFVAPTYCDDISPCRREVRIASELLLDDNITGVKCLSVIIFSLEQEDLIRIRGITELEFSEKFPHSLDMLHLKHLTVFKYVKHCSDSDLATLSKHCEKLEHVNVSRSLELTDVGLHALASCHNLNYLSVAGCANVWLSGLISVLSVNKTIRKLFAWPYFWRCDTPGFDYRWVPNWDLDPTVYSIESFTIEGQTSDRHLRSIVAKFPHLRSIKVCENIEGNLSFLKSFSKLSEIEIYSNTIADWTEFELLLADVGPQIHDLTFNDEYIFDTQIGLDSIFRLCKNLESFHFDCEYRATGGGKLVVPPFEKLRYLKCTYSDAPSPPSSLSDMDDDMDDEGWTLDLSQISQMLMLENLQVDGFVIGENRVKSMITDPMCFPNLKQMALSEFYYNTDISRVEQVVKQNNLDLELEYFERSHD